MNNKFSLNIKIKCFVLDCVDNSIKYLIERLKHFRMYVLLNSRNEIKQSKGKKLLLDLIDSK
jgi:hypothetical protein